MGELYRSIGLTCKWMSCHGYAAWTLRMPSNAHKHDTYVYTCIHTLTHLHKYIWQMLTLQLYISNAHHIKTLVT